MDCDSTAMKKDSSADPFAGLPSCKARPQRSPARRVAGEELRELARDIEVIAPQPGETATLGRMVAV